MRGSGLRMPTSLESITASKSSESGSSGRQAWHHDTYWGYLRKVRNHRPWWVMIMYMPQETPLERGPTGVLPGSQQLHRRFEGANDYERPSAGQAGEPPRPDVRVPDDPGVEHRHVLALLRHLVQQVAPARVVGGDPPQDLESALVQENIEMVIQVNGKLRGKMQVSADADRASCEAAALENDQVLRFIGDKQVKKVIVVPKKLVNIVV